MLTHFPDGVSSFGVPIMGGSGMLPRMGGNIASTGPQRNYFVDPANGLDGNTGYSPDEAMKTVSAAYAKTVDKSGDTIYLLNDGNTSGTSREDSTIVWSNDNVHLVGLCAPTLNQRARISPSSSSSTVSPQLTVSGNGNSFWNVSFVEGSTATADSTCIKVTGARNYFNGISMLNMLGAGGSAPATRAGSDILNLDGAEETTFDNCYIGTDTRARTNANTSVRVQTEASRTTFRDCFFAMYVTATTPTFVLAAAQNSLGRWMYFKDCIFNNTRSSTQKIAEWGDIHGTVNGTFILHNSIIMNATATETGASSRVWTHGATGNAAGSLGVVVT